MGRMVDRGMKKGGVVPETGNYKMHKGELVIPAKAAKHLTGASFAFDDDADDKAIKKAMKKLR